MPNYYLVLFTEHWRLNLRVQMVYPHNKLTYSGLFALNLKSGRCMSKYHYEHYKHHQSSYEAKHLIPYITIWFWKHCIENTKSEQLADFHTSPFGSIGLLTFPPMCAIICHLLENPGINCYASHFTQCKQSRWNNRNEPEAILPQQQQWGQGTGRRHTIGPKALLCLFVVNCAHTGEYHANHQNSDKNTLFFYWIHLLLEIWNQYKLFYNSREPSNNLFPCDHWWRECRPVSNICNKGTLRQIFRSFRPCLEKPLLAPLH